MADSDDILIEEQFAERRMSRALFLRLWSYLRVYRRTLFWNLLFTILATFSQLLGPKFIQVGIDHYLSGGKSADAAYHGILLISLVYLANLFLGWFLSVVQVKSAIAVGQGAMNDLRLEVFRHIQKLSLSFFDRTHQGRIISRADTDIDSMDRILTWGANQMLASALTLIGVIFFMLQFDWRLFLAVSVVLPPLFLATRLFHRHVMQAYRRMREQMSRLTAALAENIAGVRVVQAFSRQEENYQRYREINLNLSDRALEVARIFHTYMPFIGLMSGVGTAILLGYGSSLVMQNQITVGELAAFILYLGMFFGPVQTMGDLYNAVLSTAASAERIFQLLDTPPQIVNRPAARPIPRISGQVTFEKVSFRYDSTPEAQWILEEVSLQAEAGETIALVGETGSGKTTVVNLLARFYEPQRGRVLIDQVDLQEITLESLHQQIAVVTQENFLFSGSIMDNLKFGRPEVKDEVAIEAAKFLGADALIRNLPEGYATPVAERGGNLSAGQRQLICFVRAMVAEPRILILDEATSAVDSASEATIQQALEKLFARRTCFVIAHRLSTVQHADKIIVLDHGKIVETGTHSELLRRGGKYQSLYQAFIHA